MVEAASCGSIVIFHGKIPLLYRSYGSRYKGQVFPEGTVEAGKSFETTALREIRKETGVNAHIVRYISKSKYTFNAQAEQVDKSVHWYLMSAESYYSKPRREEFSMDSGYYKHHEAWHLLKFASKKATLEKAYTHYQERKRSCINESDRCTAIVIGRKRSNAMIQLECDSVMNLKNAMCGARDPLSSQARSDNCYDEVGDYILEKDGLGLTMRLRKAGSDHRKYVHQIFVSVDITAPLYWQKECGTYKVTAVTNSTSTMHRVHSKPLSRESFSHDRITEGALAALDRMIEVSGQLHLCFVETKEEDAWYSMVQLLPESYQQLRTHSFSYETLVHIYFSRHDYKLAKWHTFYGWTTPLPYTRELVLGEEA